MKTMPAWVFKHIPAQAWGYCAAAYLAGVEAGKVEDGRLARVRDALDEHRRLVADFRSSHNADCECDWDKGAMSVVESIAVALGEVPVEQL